MADSLGSVFDIYTILPFPLGVPILRDLSLDSVTINSAHLSWRLPHVMDQNPHSSLISHNTDGSEPQNISADSCKPVITGLKTKLQHGQQSQPTTKTLSTGKRLC